MHEKYMRYGQFLRAKRVSDRRELTLKDIAEELGVSVSFVSDVEQVSIPAFMSPQSGHKETAVPDMRKP